MAELSTVLERQLCPSRDDGTDVEQVGVRPFRARHVVFVADHSPDCAAAKSRAGMLIQLCSRLQCY
eukprot:COSAG02_NODE_1718_length_11207_cov_2.888999_1_plen_66_part_00